MGQLLAGDTSVQATGDGDMNGQRSQAWFEKLLRRILALTPGVYWLTLVVTEDGVKWSVQPMGKVEG